MPSALQPGSTITCLNKPLAGSSANCRQAIRLNGPSGRVQDKLRHTPRTRVKRSLYLASAAVTMAVDSRGFSATKRGDGAMSVGDAEHDTSCTRTSAAYLLAAWISSRWRCGEGLRQRFGEGL